VQVLQKGGKAPTRCNDSYRNFNRDKEQMMKRRLFMTALIAGTMVLPAITGAQPTPGSGPGPGKGPGMGPGTGMGPGAGPGKGMMMKQRWTRERLYGSPLMTLEERQEHQRQMWNAKTIEERQKIRDAHRAQMLERAKQQNYKIDQGQDDAFSVPAIPK
jgi:hypothetical protein